MHPCMQFIINTFEGINGGASNSRYEVKESERLCRNRPHHHHHRPQRHRRCGENNLNGHIKSRLIAV